MTSYNALTRITLAPTQHHSVSPYTLAATLSLTVLDEKTKPGVMTPRVLATTGVTTLRCACTWITCVMASDNAQVKTMSGCAARELALLIVSAMDILSSVILNSTFYHFPTSDIFK